MGRSAFQGVLLGTMFFQFDQSQSSAQNRFGALFISISAIVMGSVATIPELYSQRRVFYQQKNAGYFSPISWQISLVLTEIPITLIEMAIYHCYYTDFVASMVGLLVFIHFLLCLHDSRKFNMFFCGSHVRDCRFGHRCPSSFRLQRNEHTFLWIPNDEADIPEYLRWLTRPVLLRVCLLRYV